MTLRFKLDKHSTVCCFYIYAHLLQILSCSVVKLSEKQTMSSIHTQHGDQQRHGEEGACNSILSNSQGLHPQQVEEPTHYVSHYRECTECVRAENDPDSLLCNSVPGQSQGPHQQCSEDSILSPVTPSVQHRHRARCTECRRPQIIRNGRECNSVPDQSRGPHLQCSEESFHQCAIPSAQDWYIVRSTECHRPASIQSGILYNSVPYQSRGIHRQCTEEHTIRHFTTQR